MDFQLLYLQIILILYFLIKIVQFYFFKTKNKGKSTICNTLLLSLFLIEALTIYEWVVVFKVFI